MIEDRERLNEDIERGIGTSTDKNDENALGSTGRSGEGTSVRRTGEALNEGQSTSRTGKRTGEDLSDIGGTDEMDGSTGGLAGTSR